MKVSANFKKIIGKELDDQAKGPVKYYLVTTTFTCSRENFLEVDGHSFESEATPEAGAAVLNSPKMYPRTEKLKLSEIVRGRP